MLGPLHYAKVHDINDAGIIFFKEKLHYTEYVTGYLLQNTFLSFNPRLLLSKGDIKGRKLARKTNVVLEMHHVDSDPLC